MEAYRTNTSKFSGTSYSEVYKKAFGFYRGIKRKSKRRPYSRSAYFKKDKIFLGLFWHHIHEKFHQGDKVRRLKFFSCAIELIKNSRLTPASKENADNRSEILHRFTGITTENEIFFVQIKKDKRTGEKHLISVFPLK